MIAPAIAISTGGTILAAVVDARTGFIPDAISVPTAAAALAVAVAEGGADTACCGVLAAAGALLFLHAITRGRGIGLGDVKLAGAIGAGFGLPAGLTALGAAFVAGGAYGLWLLASRRAARGAEIRFGPFLALGTLLVALAPAVGALP